MEVNRGVETVNFDVKVKLEEVDRKSQMITVRFGLLLTTKPAILKLEVGGTATLTGKDEDVRKALEIDPNTKMPSILPRIYQHAFTAMYLTATVLDAPPPPHDLLYSGKEGGVAEDVNVEVATEPLSAAKEKPDGVTIQADTGNTEKKEEKETGK